MKEILKGEYPIMEMPGDGDTLVAAQYLTNRYAAGARALAQPDSDRQEIWAAWRKALRARLWEVFRLEAWGKPPTPSYRVLEEVRQDAYTRQKIVYETAPGLLASAYLLIPHGRGPSPAAICPHGHFEGASRSVVFPAEAAGAAYGHELARRGVVVLAPDNAGMGERDIDSSQLAGQHRSGCELMFIRLQHLGLDLTGLRVWELMAGVNLLQSLAEVDASRIGAAGLSGGCWLSQCLAALDERIKCVVLSGYFTTFAQTAWIGHCLCHHPMGIGALCDMSDLSALIAPRPQFIESGEDDWQYPHEPAFSLVARAYGRLGAPDNLALHRYPGGHCFNGERSIPWLARHLRG